MTKRLKRPLVESSAVIARACVQRAQARVACAGVLVLHGPRRMIRALFIKASQPAARTRLGHVQTLCITASNSSPLRGYAFALCSDPALAVAELRNLAPTIRTLTHTAKGKKPGKPLFVPSVLTVKEWEKFLVEIENLEGWAHPGKMGVKDQVRVKEGALAGFSGVIRALEGDTATVEFTILNRPCIQTVAIDLLQRV